MMTSADPLLLATRRLVELLALVDAGVERVSRGVEGEEDHLDDPCVLGDAESLGVADDELHLGATCVARVPYSVVHGDTVPEQARAGLREGHNGCGQGDGLVETGDVDARREVREAVGAEWYVNGWGEDAVVVGEADLAGASEGFKRAQGEVDAVGLELRVEVNEIRDEGGDGLDEAMYLLA